MSLDDFHVKICNEFGRQSSLLEDVWLAKVTQQSIIVSVG